MAFEVMTKNEKGPGNYRTISYSQNALYFGTQWIKENDCAKEEAMVFLFDDANKRVAFKFAKRTDDNAFSFKKSVKWGTGQMKSRALTARMKLYGYPAKTNLPCERQEDLYVLLKPDEKGNDSV